MAFRRFNRIGLLAEITPMLNRTLCVVVFFIFFLLSFFLSVFCWPQCACAHMWSLFVCLLVCLLVCLFVCVGRFVQFFFVPCHLFRSCSHPPLLPASPHTGAASAAAAKASKTPWVKFTVLVQVQFDGVVDIPQFTYTLDFQIGAITLP